ncbi:MAG TPA: S41 family peptidase [Xanthomonadales bacterium]|nr:S41 family peptidase [Xanthomonadales bacterium]
MSFSIVLLATTLAATGGCRPAFDQVVSATETNYAGHLVKLADDEARATYRRFRELMRTRAAAAADHAACRSVLDGYLGYFADHHLFVASRDNPRSPLPRPARPWTAKRVAAYFDDNDALDPIEGRWFDASRRIAVVRDAGPARGRFLALRIGDGRPAEPIAMIERDADGYRIDWQHEKWGWQRSEAHLRRAGDLLTFATRGWGRVGAKRLDGKDPLAPFAAELSDGVAYLSMPSFMPQYGAPLQAIIAEHGAGWSTARALVVDVRGNAGGDAIYFPLAPYFLANEIVVSRPSSVRASPWTVAYFESFRARLGENGAWLDEPIARMKASPGAIVPYLDSRTDGMPSYPEDPAQVVVLQDHGVGSAAEAFIFHARQSRKVTTIGEPTRGNIDYMQVSMHPVGNDGFDFWFGYPLYFSRDLPAGSVDDEGYAPDVRLGADAGDPVDFAEAWVAASAGAR